MDAKSMDLIAAFAQLDANPVIPSVLMEFINLPKPLVRYMAGPVIIHKSPWAESLPDWVVPAIYADRAELIAEEVCDGKVGELATLTEVMAYMYPATLDAPMAYEFSQTYLFAGQYALAKHNKLPEGMTFVQAIWGKDQPLELDDYIRTMFLEPLQRDIRRKVVQVAADRGVAKGRKSAQAVAEAAPESADQEPADLPNTAIQMSLFDFHE